LLTGYFREKRRRREEVGKAAQMVKIPGLRWETKAIKKEAPPRTGAAAHCAHGDGNWSRDAGFSLTLCDPPRANVLHLVTNPALEFVEPLSLRLQF
jgi:hypothetical protein